MKDGASVRTVEELREHFDIESVLGYFADGKLVTWLERAYCDDEARAVSQLTADMPDLAEKLCEIFGVEYKADAENVDIKNIQQRTEKQRLLNSITDNQEIISNADLTARDQDELQALLADSPAAIYLCGEQFSIPSTNKNIRYVGVNKPMVMLEKDKLIADYREAGIYFQDVRYISPYRTEGERLYLEGRYEEALPLLEDAAGKGNPRAMYIISVCYRNGSGTLCSEKKISEWLQQAYGMREPISSISYAECCCAKDKDKASQILSEFIEDLKALAHSGDYLAQYEYYSYVILTPGQSADKERTEAVNWFRRAAENGDARAQCFFGWICFCGKNEDQDYAKAVEWYRKAAEQGNVMAQNNLGYCYKNGKGVDQDYTLAADWYSKAAEQGNAAAQYNLGYMYEHGTGMKQDYAKAVVWYRKAAEQGNAMAQYNLGYCYKNGEGVEQDYALAAEWFSKAAEQGHTEAQQELSILTAKIAVKTTTVAAWKAIKSWF